MATLVNYDLDLKHTLVFDIDDDRKHKEGAVSVFQKGSKVFVAGYGNNHNYNSQYTYFTALDYTLGSVPSVIHFNKYYLNQTYNYPTDMTFADKNHSFVIGGAYQSDTVSSSKQYPFLIKVDTFGNVIHSYDHSGSSVFGRVLDVDNAESDHFWIGR